MKSWSVTSFMRKECKARSTFGLPGPHYVAGVRKAGQSDGPSKVSTCGSKYFALMIKLAEGLVNIRKPVTFHPGKSMDPDSSSQDLPSGYVNCPDN